MEYLYSMDTGEFYFLELNPRLQVNAILYIASLGDFVGNVASNYMFIVKWRYLMLVISFDHYNWQIY